MSEPDALPRTIESVVADIVCQVMNLSEVSLDSDLFTTYGLQSLVALRIVLAAQASEIALSIADL
jgi:acyl carrier protein